MTSTVTFSVTSEQNSVTSGKRDTSRAHKGICHGVTVHNSVTSRDIAGCSFIANGRSAATCRWRLGGARHVTAWGVR